MNDKSLSLVTGIDLGGIAETYRDRNIAGLSDRDLTVAIGQLLARPRVQPADSFVLHAPLELAARARLLPLVRPGQRELARTRMVAIAARYERFEALPLGRAGTAHVGPEVPVERLLDAIAAGDLAEADAAAAAVASTGDRARIVIGLGGPLAPLTAAAAHAPIFLFHLSRSDPALGLSTQLLRPLVRELARNPHWRLTWTDEWRPSGPTDWRALGSALAGAPALGIPGSTFIHPLLMQVDRVGVESLGGVVGHRTEEAAREVQRTAARSMLAESAVHAPYGWTHCLTLPQAVLGVTAGTAAADVGLAVAATHVAAFRAAFATATLDLVDPQALAPDDPVDLATAAATSHDAHIVKYVLACLDAAADDVEARALYLAAARRLLDVWSDAGADPDDPLT